MAAPSTPDYAVMTVAVCWDHSGALAQAMRSGTRQAAAGRAHGTSTAAAWRLRSAQGSFQSLRG